MDQVRADVALLVDFSDLRRADRLAAEGAEDALAALTRHAKATGRLAVARAYADWSRLPEEARICHGAGLRPVLVPATPDGDDCSHIQLAVDALEILYAGDEPEAYVLVTSDPTLAPLVEALRADGSEVLVVSAEPQPSLEAAADRFLTLDAVLDGAEARPAKARPWRNGHAGGGGDAPEPARADGGRTNARRRRPPAFDGNFDTYDWEPFVRLIDELENRLPFVGVRYLVNKVIGPHNCGLDDPRLKRDLINRAVDDGLIEMFPVGNVGDRSDPVTACRLDRRSRRVVDILGHEAAGSGPGDHGHGGHEPGDSETAPIDSEASVEEEATVE